MAGTLFSENVVEGGEITINNDGLNLPDQISCSLFGINGNILQTLAINTSGQEDLFLKDKYGSLTLEACDDQDCIVDITYSYLVENVGAVEMIVTEFFRERDGERLDLLGGLDPTVAVGGTSTATETESVDTCVSADHYTTVKVMAEPPGGVGCSATADYFFEINDGCRIVVEIECMAPDGTECTDLVPPTGSCHAGGPVTELKFRYVDCTCEESMNNQEGTACSDLSLFHPGAVNVACVGGDGGPTLHVSPENVMPRETLVLTDPDDSPLPDEVVCTITDGTTTIQEFTFFTDPGKSLNLDNKFGSFELVSCSDETGVGLDCEVLLSYTYDIFNIGTGDMSLEHLNRTRNNVTDSLFDLLEVTNLISGQETSLTEKELTNICVQQLYKTTVSVDAEPENGVICDDDDVYTFTINQPPTEAPSNSPSASPSASTSALPSPSPSAIPSNSHSVAPSALPSKPPIASPSVLPSALPSTSPSLSPSATPSTAPSPLPSSSPSTSPSAAPSPSPSALPSASPSEPPTPSPSESPSDSPSAAPTPEPPCIFELQADCIPPVGADSCNATPPPVEQCEGRPFEMVFLYNGGDCSGSFNVQEADGKFFCTDFGAGPPTQRGEKSYIVVTALKDDTLYHSDWVEVGSLFTLTDGGNRFVADQLITIYSDENTADPANILQSVQYHSSCSSNLFLKDRFGAVQLVIWVNEEQGTVSCFANQTFDLDVTVPIDLQGGPATVQSLTVASNVDPFFFNLTDKVFGLVVDAGDTLQTSLSIPIDLTQKRTYNLLITLTALTTTGKECQATELTSFTAGYPLPPIFPTFSPTQAPSGSATPTHNPDRAACILEADINCQSSSGRSCRVISAPSSKACDSQSGISSIDFLMTGNGCGATANCEQTSSGNIGEPEVFIEVLDGDTTVFSGVVPQGSIFAVGGPFERDRLQITISSVSNGGAGTPLQTLDRVDLACGGQVGADLTLLQNFGALQLVGFTNADQGSESIIETFDITYVVRNEGSATATVETAVGASPFEPGPIVLVSTETDLEPGDEITARTFAVVNLAESEGSQFRFDLTVTGRSSVNNRVCADLQAFAINIE
jgi:hypothetical protein